MTLDIITAALKGIAIAVAIVFVVLIMGGCHSKPPVLPPGTAVCQAPYNGEDCLDSYGKFYLFSNGLPCNLCQTAADPAATGCAWTEGPGAPNYWCVRSCNQCSAIIPTFTKSN